MLDRLLARQVEGEAERRRVVGTDRGGGHDAARCLLEDQALPVCRRTPQHSDFTRNRREEEGEVSVVSPVLEAGEVAVLSAAAAVAHRVVHVPELDVRAARLAPANDVQVQRVGLVRTLHCVSNKEQVVLEPLHKGRARVLHVGRRGDLSLGLSLGRVLDELAAGRAEDDLLALRGPGGRSEWPRQGSRHLCLVHVQQHHALGRHEGDVRAELVRTRVR